MADNVTSSFLRAFHASEDKMMKAINVAEMAIVRQILADNTYLCAVPGIDISLECKAISGLTIAANDIVVIIFTNHEFLTNLRRLKLGQPIVNNSENETLHSLSYGIIIGKL